MFTFRKAAKAVDKNTADADGDCSCDIPAATNDNTPKPTRSLSAIFKKCAMCAGGATGGLLAGHAGCIATPLIIVAAGATGLTAGAPALAIAFSVAATAGGLYVWNRLRGKQASKLEKRIVITGALAGVIISSAYNFGGGHHHHGGAMPPDMKMDMPMPANCCGTTCPPADTSVTYPTKALPMPAHHAHGM